MQAEIVEEFLRSEVGSEQTHVFLHHVMWIF